MIVVLWFFVISVIAWLSWFFLKGTPISLESRDSATVVATSLALFVGATSLSIAILHRFAVTPRFVKINMQAAGQVRDSELDKFDTQSHFAHLNPQKQE